VEQELVEQLLEWVRSHYFGKYRGTVVDNDDPTKRGRLLVNVPAVLGTVNVWAMPCVPYAGEGVGFKSLPDAKTGVWVEFEAGDLSYPIWTGLFWAYNEMPEDSSPSVRVWQTKTITHRIDDEAGELKITSSEGGELTIVDIVESLVSSTKHTVSSDSITSDAGGKVEVSQSAVKINNSSFEVM
jgi:uncharacterized protein involved in type VI secretion and phage assembly